LALVAIVAAALLAITAWAPDVSGLAPASCMPRCFCEAPRAQIPRQLANTWSNLGFVFVGGLVLGAGRDALFGWVIVFLGPASMALHATLTLGGQWIDVMSMLFLPTLLIVRNRRAPAWTWFLANGVLGALVAAWPASRRWVFAALIAMLLASELRLRRPRRRLALAGGLFALAFLAWTVDETGAWCAPTSLLQGHALWHLASAAAAGALYLHSQAARA
jgi:dihydroceramidase